MSEKMVRNVQVGRDVIEAEFFNSKGFENLLFKETKREKLYYAIRISWGKLRRVVDRAYWAVRYGVQRMFWGHDYRDLVDMDDRFIRRYTKILTKYRKNHHGYPGAMTNEEWNGIVDEMLYHLHYMLDENISEELEKGVPDGWLTTLETTNKIKDKHKDEFFVLFSKWFYYLWD